MTYGKRLSLCMVSPLFLMLCLMAALPAQAQTAPTAVPSTYMGMSLNHDSSDVPAVSFGVLRFWDSGVQWPDIEASKGVYHSGKLDDLKTWLKQAKSQGAVGFYTLGGRTPGWASADSKDTMCSYGDGECQPPTDLNADGTGSDATWIDWVQYIAGYVAGLDQNTYAPVLYWEVWNEVDRSNVIANDKTVGNDSFNGTYAQLVRMAEDARCVILGVGNTHPNGFSKDAVKCSSSTISPRGIIPTAYIVSPSSHAYSDEVVDVLENFFYCDVTGKNAPTTAQECITGSSGADAVDIINFHLKPGNYISTDTDAESEMNTLVGRITSAHMPSLPLWNGEGGFSGDTATGETAGWIYVDNYSERAAFVARYMLQSFSLGFSSVNWYTWDNMNILDVGGGSALPGDAYSEVSTWLNGATLSQACSASGSVWTCYFTKEGGYKAEAIWDVSKPCDSGRNGTCPLDKGVTIDNSTYKSYLDLQGNKTSITSGTLKVGISPVWLQTTK